MRKREGAKHYENLVQNHIEHRYFVVHEGVGPDGLRYCFTRHDSGRGWIALVKIEEWKWRAPSTSTMTFSVDDVAILRTVL